MELTKEQIKRIDIFLEGIGIEYIEIRFEMVDHIATDIENTVEDTNAFFEGKGFQVPFIKYMLSRKKALKNRYEKQTKKLHWYYTKTILKDILKKVIYPKNVLVILFFSFICFFFGPKYVKETSVFIFSSLMLNLVYTSYVSYNFTKKYKLLKIVKTYSFVSSVVIIIALNFPNFLDIFYNGNYQKSAIYVYLTAFVFNYLLSQSFLEKRDFIEKKYQYLIQ
ncbi:hypothetical protein SAMN05444344_1320 [Tenacibaculum mesophilum]|uniref:Uncharacterized protein n=1 Tax=Tenacibaculum mesophilum TaxID=104268 RepID=A0ABM7CGL3_9FLAO|nr:hypothetical protein [Tenacibaculum mesophilum]AZJ32922.1 hypothetical protein D6200_10295 [Tenacibaculum mesophilum]QFS28171.1 hypothetical protein F9Y86_07120 [Tenacibaculum mesophilum]SHF71205.1 hypothetical protein SAMN05444344_1320 [Tenacibaculum mesophilum]